MNATHQQIFQACSKDFVGLPYEEFDCWRLAVLFYSKVFGIELLQYSGSTPEDREITENLIYSNKGEFERVGSVDFGDLVLIYILGFESHIGIYIGNGYLLHTTKNTNSCIEKLDRFKSRVSGFYRIKK